MTYDGTVEFGALDHALSRLGFHPHAKDLCSFLFLFLPILCCYAHAMFRALLLHSALGEGSSLYQVREEWGVSFCIIGQCNVMLTHQGLVLLLCIQQAHKYWVGGYSLLEAVCPCRLEQQAYGTPQLIYETTSSFWTEPCKLWSPSSLVYSSLKYDF